MGICQAKLFTLKPESKHGYCRSQLDNDLGANKTKFACSVELDHLSFEDAKTACAAATNKKGLKCKLTTTKQTGWYRNVATCKSPNGDLHGENDTCNVSYRNSEGQLDDKVFEANCAAAKDKDGNKCEFTPVDKSEDAWTKWSVLEVLGFTASFFVMVGMVLSW